MIPKNKETDLGALLKYRRWTENLIYMKGAILDKLPIRYTGTVDGFIKLLA